MLASFEKTTDHLFDAALHGRRDDINGVRWGRPGGGPGGGLLPLLPLAQPGGRGSGAALLLTNQPSLLGTTLLPPHPPTHPHTHTHHKRTPIPTHPPFHSESIIMGIPMPTGTGLFKLLQNADAGRGATEGGGRGQATQRRKGQQQGGAKVKEEREERSGGGEGPASPRAALLPAAPTSGTRPGGVQRSRIRLPQRPPPLLAF